MSVLVSRGGWRIFMNTRQTCGGTLYDRLVRRFEALDNAQSD